jgi:hypothetical protein
MKSLLKNPLLPPVLSLVMLGGIGWARRSMTPPPASASYHEAVRAAAAAAPVRIGTWVGKEVPIPNEAIKLLRPNVAISRQFTDVVTGESVTFLLIHCTDIRDLYFHYPPICYPYRGWRQIDATPKDWAVNGVVLNGTEYAFESSTFERANTIAVENFMILPNGQTSRDMKGILAQPLESRYYGAGQVQLVVDAGVSPGRRDAVFAELLRGHRELIEAIRDGLSNAHSN